MLARQRHYLVSRSKVFTANDTFALTFGNCMHRKRVYDSWVRWSGLRVWRHFERDTCFEVSRCTAEAFVHYTRMEAYGDDD